MPTTISRGLVRYQGSNDTRQDRRDDGWQEQVDLAAACLAAAALRGGMAQVAGTLTERQLARYMSQQAQRRRRTSTAKLAVILAGNLLALVAGCYIGLLG